MPCESWEIGIPEWFLLTAPAILPAFWIYRRAKSRHISPPGLCLKCGYDLRATPNRCPECGTVPLKNVAPSADLPMRPSHAPQ